MMTKGIDQTVGFEVAILAKKKGFVEFCLNAFLLKYKPDFVWDTFDRELNSGEEEGIEVAPYQQQMIRVHRTWRNTTSQPQIIARPTQTALSKWLRTEHGIYIELIIDGWGDDNNISTENIGYRAFIWQVGKPRPQHNDDLGMHNYEKIMDVALEHALELINPIT